MLSKKVSYKLPIGRVIIYGMLFVCSILIVFRVIPYLGGTLLVTLFLVWLDKKALLEVNYPLLFTFVSFFVFSGNMARIPQVSLFFQSILPKSPLLVGTLSCQFISNVPSAVLLSKFTDDYANLLVAVNIGGCGTLIASLASLITYSEYKKHNPNKVSAYIRMFSIINFGFLFVLIVVQQLLQ